MEAYLVFLLVLLAYSALIIILGQTGILSRLNIQAFGPLLVWRTGRGRALLERLAKARRFWAVFSRLSVVLVFATMGMMVFILLAQLAFIRNIPADQVDVQYAIGIPGVNPLIPVGFGIVGLAVAILVHEGCHGILARAEGIKVRSVGLLIAIAPIGAFVEPDEQEMRAAPLPKRQRVYGVGPASNIVLAIVFAGIFSAGFMGSLAPVDDGVVVTAVLQDSAAFNASVLPYMLIDAVGDPNGTITDLHGPAEFSAFLAARRPFENITLHVIYNGERSTLQARLGQRPVHNPALSDAVLGVFTEAPENFTQLARPGVASTMLCTGGKTIGSGCYAQSFALFLGMPIRGETPAPAARQALYVPTGPLAGLGGAFWVIADLCYWLFWLNFMVGTFNALPMLPLDGGHMFKDAVLGILRKRAGTAGDTPEAQAKRRKERIEMLEADLVLIGENLERTNKLRAEAKAAAEGEGATPFAGKEAEDFDREARELETEVERLKEALEIERGEGTGAAPAKPAPADDLFGPRRFRDALDRKAHAYTSYMSLLMLVLIVLPFVVPRLLGTGN